MADEPTVYDETAAAHFMGVSIRTVQSWRLKGGGPAYMKLGRSVRYRRETLEAFMAASERSHTSQKVA
jgi:excisionase family DNA binding protein